MGIRGLIFATAIALSSGMANAQDAQTLADIRQELTVLHVEVQRLKRELSTTGAPAPNLSGGSVLERVDTIEAELQRLTSQTERMSQRIDRVVSDGTNRIGDLEFRLVELEGGDVSALGETTTLGGDTAVISETSIAEPDNSTDTELAVGEKAEFDAAKAALDAGDHRKAADLLANFDASYPGSPLGPQAHLNRGKALEGLGDTREAARAFLASFTNDSTGPVAAEALYELGSALGRLGQVDQACVTLAEVAVRFPAASAVAQAQSEMTSLGCS